VPLIDTITLLVDDHKGYIPPPALELTAQGAGAPATPIEGALFTKGIVNAYIIAILELWRVQVTYSNGNIENPHSITIRGFLE
jgi:hypothetical protein